MLKKEKILLLNKCVNTLIHNYKVKRSNELDFMSKVELRIHQYRVDEWNEL